MMILMTIMVFVGLNISSASLELQRLKSMIRAMHNL